MGLPEDIVAAAVFLASAGTKYFTGQLIVVDGAVSWTCQKSRVFCRDPESVKIRRRVSYFNLARLSAASSPGAQRLAPRLAHQHLGWITQRRTVLDTPPCGLTRILCALTHLLGKHCAAVEIAPETVGQLRTAAWALDGGAASLGVARVTSEVRGLASDVVTLLSGERTPQTRAMFPKLFREPLRGEPIVVNGRWGYRFTGR